MLIRHQCIAPMAWGCTCWANSVFGNVCTTSAILGPNGHFGTYLQSRTPTCLTCAITNLLFADNCMASEEDMRHFVWQGGCIYRVECVHTCTAPWSCCAVAWLPRDADRVLTVTSQEPKKWHTLQYASRSFSHGVGCHLLLLRWLWGLIY